MTRGDETESGRPTGTAEDVPPDAERGSPPPPDAGPAEREKKRRRARALAMLTIVTVLACIALVVAILRFGGSKPSDLGRPDENWHAVDSAPAQKIDLDQGEHELIFVVGTVSDETCWNGVIIEEEISGCGGAVFEVTGAPSVVGANVVQDDSDKTFLGLAVWDGEGKFRLDTATTRKPSGAVAVTATQ